MKEYKVLDGNGAVALTSYNFSEICGIYPITPASPMAERVDVLSNSGLLNYFGNKVRVVEMQSEAGAVALVHGALQSGSLGTTFTASQGLLLMIPTLYKLAGEMLPAVIHVSARSLSTHALSIFGDHQDIYATRMTGCCILASSSVEQAYHLSNVAHLSAIKGSLPFIHFFDGFRTSHEINKVETLNYEKIKQLIDVNALKDFKERAMNPLHPNTRGTAENDDIYFQHIESRNADYDNMVKVVENNMTVFNGIAGTNYKPFNYYGKKDAKHVIIAMGSICETAKETIDYLNNKGYKVGLVEVHLYRPFSANHLINELPKTVKSIAVLDRTKEPGSYGEPLFLDVSSALKIYNIDIVGGRYGLSSKDTTPNQIKAVFDFLKKGKLYNGFTIGIEDDVTNLSLPIDANFRLPNNNYELLIYGYGSDGMVSTSKDILEIIGEQTENYVQGYFQYDSKKSGGVTRSHLRISKDKIRSSYYVNNPSLLVVSKDSYMYKYDLLDGLKENGILFLNTNLNEEQLLETLPNKVKYMLAKKKIKCYYIDAFKIVNELGLKNKISTCMEVCLFKILEILDIEEVKNIMKSKNEKRFKSKGDKIVDINNKVVENSIDYIKELPIDSKWSKLDYKDIESDTFNKVINNLKGDSLPVSAFVDKKTGIFPGETTKLEKRSITETVPHWIKENCIQCNQCSYVCPHAVVRPFVLKEDASVETIPAILPKVKDLHFSIGVSYEDCTGCTLCVKTCPGKKDNKALEMKPYEKDTYKQESFEYLMKNNVNEYLDLSILNVKNSQFIMPKFEFSGACAGCGETQYLKALTQIFGDTLMIANATGCTSIYGASAPNTPYSVPWASSLFEDNSEYGLGILIGSNNNRIKVQRVFDEKIDKVDEDTAKLFKKWSKNYNDYNVCKEVYDNLDYKKYSFLNNIKEYILPKSVWVVGGDGFAYDIGYGGLDHVLSTNENINILVLDTEVYSNTGGQSSKSSHLGSIASFTSNGKKNYKKDLARMALAYPHVYVATVNIGYDKEQYLKAIKEANAHDGPSIVIAYAPCIEHGIKNGMEDSLINAHLATKSGYYPIFRYNPDNQEFNLDSKDVDFNLYNDFLNNENRYRNLKEMNKEEAKSLLEKNKEWAINRYNFYKNMTNNKEA